MKLDLSTGAKNFGVQREILINRQMRALQSRHDRGLTDKIVARAIDRHPATVGNWRTGVTEMGIGDMAALDDFFSSLGDWMFIEHLFGDLAVRRKLRAQQLEEQARQLRESAAFLQGEKVEAA